MQEVEQTFLSHFIEEHFPKHLVSVTATSRKLALSPLVLQGDVCRYLKVSSRVARRKGFFQSLMILRSYSERKIFQEYLNNQL